MLRSLLLLLAVSLCAFALWHGRRPGDDRSSRVPVVAPIDGSERRTSASDASLAVPRAPADERERGGLPAQSTGVGPGRAGVPLGLLDDDRALFEARYGGLAGQEIDDALGAVSTAYRLARDEAFEELEREGRYIVSTPDERGFTRKPAAVPDGAIYRSVTNPDDARETRSGTTTVRHLFLRRDEHAEVYRLKREREWLMERARSDGR